MKHAEHVAAIASESAFTQRRGRDSSTRRAGAVLPPHFSPRGSSHDEKFPTLFGRCNEDLESSTSFDCIQDNELKTSQVKGYATVLVLGKVHSIYRARAPQSF